LLPPIEPTPQRVSTRRTQEKPNENRIEHRQNGRSNRQPPYESRPRAYGLEPQPPAKTLPLAAAGAKMPRPRFNSPSSSDAVITILTDGAAIDVVYHGTDGLSPGRLQKLFSNEHRPP